MLIHWGWGIFFSLKDMTDSAGVRFVVFSVGDLTCALPVARIREILPAQTATRIPGAPISVDGLVNVRGTLLTVVSGHELLNRAPTPDSEGAVLVVEVAGRSLGLVVDAVLDLVEVAAGALEPRDALPGVDPRLAEAVGASGDHVFVVLDTDTLLAPLIG